MDHKDEKGEKGDRDEEFIKDIHKCEELKVLIKGFFLFDDNIKELYNTIKSIHNDVNIVIINPNIVFGLEHIIGIIKIIYEEIKRKEERDIKNIDVEFLLRICHTNQISHAFQILNDDKNNKSVICILFCKSLTNLKNAYNSLKTFGKEDDANTLIQTSKAKKLYILKCFFKKDLNDYEGIDVINDDREFQKFLIERSAIALK